MASTPFRINSQPLYVQATAALRTLIRENRYRPGDMLPSEDVLARDLGVSRLTLREALGYLENDGIIERRRGVGTFVSEQPGTHFAGGLEQLETFRSLARLAGLQADTTAREVSVVPASDEWAGRLDVPPGTELVRVRATQAVGGSAAAYFDGLAPLNLADLDAVRSGDGSLLEYLFNSRTRVPTHARSSLYAINADAQICQILGVTEGTAILHLFEVCYVGNRRPLAIAYNYFLTHCFNFYIARRVAVHSPRALRS